MNTIKKENFIGLLSSIIDRQDADGLLNEALKKYDESNCYVTTANPTETEAIDIVDHLVELETGFRGIVSIFVYDLAMLGEEKVTFYEEEGTEYLIDSIGDFYDFLSLRAVAFDHKHKYDLNPFSLEITSEIVIEERK
ncbi:MAG: hypothetical protein EOL95_09330 [Bacteroidia bacterium]|nr:hypothetical protein [Bacteroidia bacterium]